MARDLLLAIDVGTGSVRAALLTGTGETLAFAAAEHEQIVPQYGWSEQRPADWWTGAVAVIRRVLDMLPGAAARVAAIGACGQMHATVLVDADGQPALEAVPLWNDKRNRTLLDTFMQEQPWEALLPVAGNPPSVAWWGFKLQWLKAHRPEAYARTALVLSPKDWINFRLTGAVAIDAPEASCTYLFDVRHGTWSDALAQRLGLDPKLLPPIREPYDVLAGISRQAAAETGLHEGTPVVVGISDYPAALLGSGVIEPGLASDVTGTSTLLTLCTTAPVLHPVISNVRGALPNWSAFTILDAGGDAMRWARRAFHENHYEYDRIVSLAAGVPAGAGSLVFLPYLNGERLGERANSRAQFIGLTSGHGAGHLHRAVMEGVAFAAARNLRIMEAAGNRLDRVVAAGGGAKTPLWLEIKASLYGCPILTTAAEESGVLGCAMLAGTGIGLYPDLPAAVSQLVRFTGEIQPNPRWMETYARLQPVFDHAYTSSELYWTMLEAAEAADTAAGSHLQTSN
ncbi:pentose kinase [Lichenicola cladoniae]|uniref:Pentose kinase n=1 Tax=Lichenicola cladoniae TaxID=1484109 RepID=A0A6M8HG67_9PROT|nr:FGGY family carbohydrate kinase [Lichenicola cladoniae]NPD66734.1 pentose kinase [Acetobacteraceae bacterium]QKE88682.1 pentose kinase [Lichenicola cladoniae]